MREVKKPVAIVLLIYFVCCVFRVFEYMIMRTDQTVIGEAFVHKVLGILVMCAVLRMLYMNASDIGFTRSGILKYLAYGIGFGLAVFAIGYGVEIVICKLSGNFVSLDFYVTSYAIDKNVNMNSTVLFILICIVGNILNVVMEEGVFRGLFQKLLETKYSFLTAALFSSFIFGIWHTMGPVRNYLDGTSSLNGAAANALMLGITSALIGFKFAMLSHMEGALYMGMGDHFVNNTIVNLLHVTGTQGADELMFLRITAAQTISFLIVLVVYLKQNQAERLQTRNESDICKGYENDHQKGATSGAKGY